MVRIILNMSMNQSKLEVIKAVKELHTNLPDFLHDEFLLTGGAAALFYGSDRPFSHDVDFMFPKKYIETVSEALKVEFEMFRNKPVFHSLKVVYQTGGHDYDLVAQSIVEPQSGVSCTFELNDMVYRNKKELEEEGQKILLIPKELLFLIKLVAGRGEELGKYDLYDAEKILEKNPDFDFGYLEKLIREFCQPLKKVLPFLEDRAGKIRHSELERHLEFLRRSV